MTTAPDSGAAVFSAVVSAVPSSFVSISFLKTLMDWPRPRARAILLCAEIGASTA